MNQHEPPSRAEIQQAAVRLINTRGVDAVTVDAVCADAGIDEAGFRHSFASVDELLVAINTTLIDTYIHNITSTFARRRSLTDSIQVAFAAYWDTVEVSVDMHLAARRLRLAVAARDQEAGRAMFMETLASVEGALRDIEQVHSIEWELPVSSWAGWRWRRSTGWCSTT